MAPIPLPLSSHQAPASSRTHPTSAMAAVADFNSSEAHHVFLSTFLGTLGTPRLAVSHHLLQGNVSALWTVVETCALLADCLTPH